MRLYTPFLLLLAACEGDVIKTDTSGGVGPDESIDGPDVTLTPTSIAFGDVAVGSTGSSSFTLGNLGDQDLVVDLEIGIGEEAFAASISTVSVAPGASEAVTVSFTPLVGGEVDGLVRLATNDDDELALSVILSGTGTDDGDTAGEDSAGEDSAGEDSAGEDSAGEDSAGEDTAEDTADTGVEDTADTAGEDTADTADTAGTGPIDADGDGYTAAEDCDDTDASVNPGASELCDTIDNDCDGSVDSAAADEATWYSDADGDGYGETRLSVIACDAPAGYVADDTDCDDADATVNPGATEVCDAVDNNCDGTVDNTAWYADVDVDGYGDAATLVTDCAAPAGYVADATDCNDADAAVNPGADEYCNATDDDCDGIIDDDAVNVSTWYADVDIDGYGDASSTATACEAPAGYLAEATDCDDAADAVNPGATEVCDGIDNDCDGIVDSAAADEATWYVDADADGYGDAGLSMFACDAPAGYVADGTDCNDADFAVNPGATEVCDAVDNNCDGALDNTAWYADIDVDGYGDAATLVTDCAAPAGYVADGTDCDDADAAVSPGADEYCNGIDDDCDGTTDDEPVDGTIWYADVDVDGYGDASSTATACELPAGYLADATDCDDTDAAVNPAATEVCNDLDDDCDGSVDEDAPDAPTWYADADADSYGTTKYTTAACDQPSGYVANSSDCNDTAAAVNPRATEVCNDIDDDCDGVIDTDATDRPTWYADGDADGYGTTNYTTAACDQPSGYVADSSDCNDTAAAVNPAATEVCNGIDDDCSGNVDENTAADADTWYADIDVDGYGDASSTATACVAPAGYVFDRTDCDDTDAAVNPAATEVCNGIDDDCDGAIDPADSADATSWYADADSDTYGNASGAQTACEQPTGFVADSADCDDTDAAVNPAATEVCNDIDDNCDGVIDTDATNRATWYADADGDSYGEPRLSELACDAPAGYVADETDCKDTDAAVNPGAAEVCNDIDDNCDGVIDTDATDRSIWYADADSDTYGNSSASSLACDVPAGYVADKTDCDDTSSAINPAATEVCNGIDDDCDGVIDPVDSADASTWYADADADRYGTTNYTTIACAQPNGYVADSSDCNDTDAAVNPAATEVCNDIDDNCDGVIDTDATDRTTWYADSDGDRYGTTNYTTTACDRPTGYVANSTDCNDLRAAVNPGATEVCNGRDDNCDGVTDTDATDRSTWYADADSDTYGNASVSSLACDVPAGYVADKTDCNDANASVNPAATEVCNGIDDDCDGAIDPAGSADATSWYADADSDTYGNAAVAQTACDAPAGFVADATDCDDTRAAVNPVATEVCNGLDDNCDGVIDTDATNRSTWYVDIDSDTYGNASVSSLACDAPAGYVADATDCNDASAAVNPAATEVCNDIDDNCDGVIDTDATDKTAWYADADSDAYGNASVTSLACDAPAGYVADKTDCNDANASVNPAATEVCNGIDDNCDGVIDPADSADATSWYADADSDTYGNAAVAQTACDAPAGFVADKTDCDDTRAAVNPVATEVCNGLDDNCDGVIDTDAINRSTWYVDTDSDTFGNASVASLACDAPAGYVADKTDCNDANSAVNPAATEVCNDIDDNCDGVIDTDAVDPSIWYIDADSDTYGNAAVSTNACDAPAGYVADATDCDDTDASVNPGTPEVSYNGTDDNCDGYRDNMVAAEESFWTIDGSTSSHAIGNLGTWTTSDMNGDGDDELFIAATGDDTAGTNAGAIAVHDDGVSGTGVNFGSGWLLLTGSSSGDAAGSAATWVGDVDSDGHDEMSVGAYLSNAAATDGGVVYTFDLYSFSWWGAGTALSGTEEMDDVREGRIVGENASAWFGYSLANGDLDGDGETDLVVGAPGTLTARGRVHIYSAADDYMSDDIGSDDAGTRPRGVTASDNLGYAVLVADWFADGIDELVACAPGADPSGRSAAGTCYYLTGEDAFDASTDLITAWDSAMFTGAAAGDQLGYGPLAVAAGDLDGDGTDDLAIGAPGYDGAVSAGGGVGIWSGGSAFSGTNTFTSADKIVQGDGALGLSLSIGGDVDSDGIDDLLAGAPTATASTGMLYLVLGGPLTGTLTLPGDEGASWAGSTAGDGLGMSVGGLNDLDNDGFLDFAVAASGEDSGATNGGLVYVLPAY